MPKYPAPTPPKIPARWHGGEQRPLIIVLHSTVSPCVKGGARNIGRYFATTGNKTSAHYGVDPGEEIQYVGDHTVAYHCGYNQGSIGIEMCEYPSRTNMARWFTKNHRAMRARTVRLVAELCLAYEIPPYYRSAASLKRGNLGVTTHNEMSKAYKRSTHWDPGTWPRWRFMRAVRKQITQLKNDRKDTP